MPDTAPAMTSEPQCRPAAIRCIPTAAAATCEPMLHQGLYRYSSLESTVDAVNAHDVWREGNELLADLSGRSSWMLCFNISVAAAFIAIAPTEDVIVGASCSRVVSEGSEAKILAAQKSIVAKKKRCLIAVMRDKQEKRDGCEYSCG